MAAPATPYAPCGTYTHQTVLQESVFEVFRFSILSAENSDSTVPVPPAIPFMSVKFSSTISIGFHSHNQDCEDNELDDELDELLEVEEDEVEEDESELIEVSDTEVELLDVNLCVLLLEDDEELDDELDDELEDELDDELEELDVIM